jgi:pimeloyl-ACP methyl ester carboxylesterase
MSYATNNGVRIYYEVVGSGRPLLLHHGSLGAEKIGETLAMSMRSATITRSF